jgi:hypothetical protein
MTDQPFPIELFFICTPLPLPESQHEEVRRTLSTWGYDLLELQQTPPLAEVSPHPCMLVLAAQDLQPDVRNEVNQRIFKAARSLGRQLKRFKADVVTPEKQQDHEKMLQRILPERAQPLIVQTRRNLGIFRPPYPVLRTLNNHSARTRVDVVDFKGKEAVCKTFRSSALDYLQREMDARAALGQALPEISPVLERGENYFIMPLYHEAFSWKDDGLCLYPVDKAKACMEFLRHFHAQGYAIVDAHPGTFLFDRDEGLRVADLEYFTPQPDKKPFKESFDIAGPPESFKGILPADRAVTYQSAWYPIIGVNLNTLMTSPPLKLHLLRLTYLLTRRLPKGLIKKAGGMLPRPDVSVKDGLIFHWPRRTVSFPRRGT